MKNPNTLKIFILEDDAWYGSMIQHYLSLNPDFEVKRFGSANDFFHHLHEGILGCRVQVHHNNDRI